MPDRRMSQRSSASCSAQRPSALHSGPRRATYSTRASCCATTSWAKRCCAWAGTALSPDNLAAYQAIGREPVRIRYRDREVLTNPPPSAGGTLLAYALALLDRGPVPPRLSGVVEAMGAAQSERTAG